jgi:exodeoxyribonuclease V alpha subunit
MTDAGPVSTVEPGDPRLARSASGALQAFNVAGVLDAADVHVATRLGALGGERDEAVLLAAALAVRGPRLAHVCVDLADARDSVTSELESPIELADLPWPDKADWLARLEASPLVAAGQAEPPEPRPVRLDGTRLYLDRYWRQECKAAAALIARGASRPAVDEDALEAGLTKLFRGSDPADRQRAAAAASVRSSFSVVAGGPGTGKTTTVARIVVLLDEQSTRAGRPRPRVALAAPTGKAAARLEEAVHGEAGRLDVEPAVKARLFALTASTLHRLLGWRPGSRSRFRHDRSNRLPYDVVIVDETSMVSTSMMANLVDAVAPDARLILVGDPDQLASVEAGAVLGDIVGPASDHATPRPRSAIADGIVVLRHVHRFGGAIAEVADAVRRGDADATCAVLREGHGDVLWIAENGDASGAVLDPIRAEIVESGRRLTNAARAGHAAAALAALSDMRVLCAHRRGRAGVAGWTTLVERWLSDSIGGYAADGLWYVGRPLLVTENDYSLRLYNGDTGVVVQSRAGVVAAFERAGGVFEVSPRRISAVDTVHAMTIHKSQGSQFAAVAVVLPEPSSPILTRELLYTAVTRAQRRLIVLGTEESVRAAVERPVARATGLRERLWQ